MKFLHYSDVGAANILDLYKQSDVLITTGDLRFTDFPGIELLPNKIPSFGVLGNHDDGATYLERNGILNVHNKVVDFNGIKIGGFQGCLRYNSRDIQYTEEEAKEFADTFPYVDILILHAGPLGLLDDASDPVHIGSESILRYVKEKTPKIVFVGHQYSDEEMTFGNTKLFRTYGARIITVDDLVPTVPRNN